jgi:predicted acylesterase/phospholipase RssA
MTQRLQCDLVMRGGITSGIVYPRAIAKLAETYDFRCIGGTSAGAIAAAGTAAAMYGKKMGGTPFEDRLKGLPEELSDNDHGTKPTRLERLFQPQRGTRRLFRLLMSGLGRENKALKVLRMLVTLWLNYWPLTLLGAAIGFGPLLLFALNSSLACAWFVALLAVGAISGAVLMTVAAAVGVVLDILKRLPKNRYGMSSGSKGTAARDDDDNPPLTDWLHRFFQDVAGRPLDEPLTFGQLWGANGDPKKPRDIDLVLMTTNITRGISQRLPFIEGSWGQLFFNEDDFNELFPPSVVAWMREHAADVRHAEDLVIPERFYALPPAKDIPILIGARMSLSFPFLLSAVPLWSANVTRKNKAGKIELERCWFSDGGLTSNFPIHFFDSPLPSRPTFGINLVPESVAIGDQSAAGADKGVVSGLKPGGKALSKTAPGWDKIYMPSTNSSGIGSAARFNQFADIIGFFGALFDTARNWADTELMAMPGYRDRIVHVALAEDEGGLNLNMPKEIIDLIGERGERAGELLTARFALDPKPDPQSGKAIWLTWDNHRWVRFRSFMAALEDTLRRFRNGWEQSSQASPPPSYEALLKRTPGSAPKSYPTGTVAQRDYVIETTQKLLDCIEKGTVGDHTFDRGKSSKEGRSPRPKPVLRMTPPGSNDPLVERAGTLGETASPTGGEVA